MRGRGLSDDQLLSLYGTAGVYLGIGNASSGFTVQDYFNSPYGYDSVILGRNQSRYNSKVHGRVRGDPATAALTWNLTRKRGHGICFSTTGGGKNTNLITPALLGYGGSVLVLDPKGENAWLTAERRRRMGYKVVILDPFDQVNRRYGSKVGIRETVGKFNPLAHINPRSPDFAMQIATVVEGITTVPERGDPHWAESARELLAGLIAAITERAPGVGSFRQVRTLLTLSDEELAMLITLIVERGPNSLAARKLRRFAIPTRENSSIRSSLLTQTAILDTARLLDCMETDRNALDLRELATGRVALYVVLPPQQLLTYGRWMRMIVQLAIDAIGAVDTMPKPPVLFVLDELGTINPGAGLPSIEQAYGLMGGLGIRIWSFFQNIGQVKRDYPANWETMIANSEVIQLMRVNDNSTADYFSQHIGSKTILEINNGQRRAFGVSAMDPMAIKSMPDDHVLTMRSGGDNFLLPTFPYFMDPGWKGKFRADPNYPPPQYDALPRPSLKLGAGSPIGNVLGGLAAKDRELSAAAVKWAKGDGVKMAKDAAAKAATWWKSATEKPEPPVRDERGVKRGKNPHELDEDGTIEARRKWAETLRGFSDEGKPKK